MDIRVLSVDELHCALAVLAGDGPDRLRDIVGSIAALPARRLQRCAPRPPYKVCRA